MVVFEVVLGTVALVSIVACATVLPAMELFEARPSRRRRNGRIARTVEPSFSVGKSVQQRSATLSTTVQHASPRTP